MIKGFCQPRSQREHPHGVRSLTVRERLWDMAVDPKRLFEILILSGALDRRTAWIWIAIDLLGKRFLNAVIGTRCVVTGEQLWEAIKSPLIAQIMTDNWEPT